MATPARAPEIEALFLPASVCAYTADASADQISELHDDERVSLAPMVANRQAEFATARACARASLAELGVSSPVPRRDGGAPQWPVGIAGSISHTRGFCVGVASIDQVAIGIDMEEYARMKPSIERRILVDDERQRLGTVGGNERRKQVAAIFAAKEAFYKAHYEVDARYLGFDAVSVTVEGDLGGENRVRYAPASGDVGADLLARTAGRLRIDRGRVIVGVCIETSDLSGTLPSPA